MTNKNNPFEGKAIKYDTIEQLNHLVEIAEGAGIKVGNIDTETFGKSNRWFRKNSKSSYYSCYSDSFGYTSIPYSDFMASLEVKHDPFKGKCLKCLGKEDVDEIMFIATNYNIPITHNDEVIPCWFHYSDYYKGYIFSKHEIKICVDVPSFLSGVDVPETAPSETPTFTPIRPAHYESGKISPLDFIEDKGLNFHLGNALKYIVRAGKKDPSKLVEDLDKAMFYLQRHINNAGEPPRNKLWNIDTDEFIFDKELPHLLGKAVSSIVFMEYKEAISYIDKYKSLCQN